MHILILGGTSEARACAEALVGRGHHVVSSLAGRVSNPRLPVGEVRIGGFGGADGLAQWLRKERPGLVVDATHPYATTMTAHAHAACTQTDTPVIRLARPGWETRADAGEWTWASTYDEARQAAEALGDRAFITTGRQTLHHYLPAWADKRALVRVVEPLSETVGTGDHEHPVPTSWDVLRDRGPYTADGERALMREHRIDVLLTKDSGGAYTAAKLDAARELGVHVVVVRRPAVPAAMASVATVDEIIAAVDTLASS